MYISYNGGDTWSSFQLNLPPVPITDLTIKNNDLIVATQGRSFWALDDLTLVQQKQKGLPKTAIYIFPVNEAYRKNGSQDLKVKNAGVNPPNGAVINYYIKSLTDSSNIDLYIFDHDKKLVKKFNNKAPDKGDTGKLDVAQGMNTLVWDMTYAAPEKLEGMVLWNEIGGSKAVPGKYYVRVVADKKDSMETNLEVKANPNFKATQQEYDEQFSFLSKVKDKFSEIQKAIKDIREIRKQIADFMTRQGKDTAGEIKILADSINNGMTKIEEALHQTKAKSEQDVLNYPIRLNDKIAGLYNYASSGNYAPTKQVQEAYVDLSKQADDQLNKLKKILGVDVPKLNQLIRQKQLPIIGVTPTP
jgi:hypothetical protein